MHTAGWNMGDIAFNHAMDNKTELQQLRDRVTELESFVGQIFGQIDEILTRHEEQIKELRDGHS